MRPEVRLLLDYYRDEAKIKFGRPVRQPWQTQEQAQAIADKCMRDFENWMSLTERYLEHMESSGNEPDQTTQGSST